MAHLITFRTSRFDISKEAPNPTNPIFGRSVLMWLRGELAKVRYETTEPASEDWGWYMDAEGPGGAYLVGASGEADGAAEVEWAIQIHKHRSLKEKLLGRNRMTADDPLSAAIERIVRADTALEQVTVDRDA